MKPTNRKCYDTLESDIVYPLDQGYCYIAQLDKKWVEFRLRCMGVRTINNKYCVALESNNGQVLLVTNHDGEYFLTAKRDSKNSLI